MWVLLQRGRLELVLRPLPTHCSWAQKGSQDVAVPRLAPGVCCGSLSLLAQFLGVVGFLALGRRCFLTEKVVAWGWIVSGRQKRGGVTESMLINKRPLFFSPGSRTPGELPPQTGAAGWRGSDGLVSMRRPLCFSWTAARY